MRIAIASDDERNIAEHFGRTRGFLVGDLEHGALQAPEYRLNTFTGHARGLAGAAHEVDRHGPIVSALKDCQVVISRGMGRRMYDDLKRAGVEVYVTEETECARAVELYASGALVDRPDLGCQHHHH